MGWASVDSLFSLSKMVVVKDINLYLESLSSLPTTLKDEFLKILGLRGTLNGKLLRALLHPSVKELNLADSNVDDYALSAVALCRFLMFLDLSNMTKQEVSFTSATLIDMMEHIPYLTVLRMYNCDDAVTDDVVVTLSRSCPHLRQLDIGGCSHVTDLALYALAQNCRQLSCLSVSRTQVTDSSIISLANSACHDNLFELQLRNCEKVTDSSIEAIINMCSKMSVLIFDGCPLIRETSLAVGELQLRKSPIKFASWTCY